MKVRFVWYLTDCGFVVSAVSEEFPEDRGSKHFLNFVN